MYKIVNGFSRLTMCATLFNSENGFLVSLTMTQGSIDFCVILKEKVNTKMHSTDEQSPVLCDYKLFDKWILDYISR